METIYKYELDLRLHMHGEYYILRMPKGATILHVGSQKPRHVHIWATVNTEAEIEDNPIFVVGTGQAMPIIDVEHIGTVTDGMFIWHVFEPKVGA